jgi:branched-chain amino acid transport system ATP-binding protein
MKEFIRRIRSERNLTIILIEHDMKMVMDISDFVIVLEFGQCIAHGKPREIRSWHVTSLKWEVISFWWRVNIRTWS